jgi:hypothetical protein
MFIIFIIFIFNPENITNKVRTFVNDSYISIEDVDVDVEGPTKTINGQYYDYTKLNIKPTITLVPPTIINIPPIIKGSVISTTEAGDEYKKLYVQYSGTDVPTILDFDNLKGKQELKPNVIVDLANNNNIFEWKDVKTKDLCYIPETYIPEKDDYLRDKFRNKIKDGYIKLGKCTKNNAQYRIINGYIQHIHSNKFIRPASNYDQPPPNDNLLLSDMPMREITVKDEQNQDKKLEFPEFFINGYDDIEKYKFIYDDNKLKHLSSSSGGVNDICASPICLSNNNIDYNCSNDILLSLVKCNKIPT